MALRGDFDAPIPGENFTSDTKNYPWHRPPDFDDVNKAIEYSFKHLTKKGNAYTVLTLFEDGVSIAQLARTFVIAGVGSGKWTPDFALLIVGPVARILQMMAKGYGVKADLGIAGDERFPTKTFAQFMKTQPSDDIDEEKADAAVEDINVDDVQDEAASQETPPTIAPPTKGLGARPQGMM